MQIESSNNSDEKDFSQSLKIEKENINCKDGFLHTIQNENRSLKKIK